MELSEKEYAKAFNAGYLLSQNEPDLLAKILKSPDQSSEYLHAIEMGKKQHNREQLLEQLKQSQKNNGIEKER